MNKKSMAAALLALALTPCIALFGCAEKDSGKKDGTDGKSKLSAQVTASKNTYDNIYGRAKRCGGMFNRAEQSASAMKGSTADSAQGSEKNSFDSSEEVNQLIEIIKGKLSLSYPNVGALNTYAMDLFAYTQIADSVIENDGEKAFTRIYDVNYFGDDGNLSEDFAQRVNAYWSGIKIPEVIDLSGYDEQTHKIALSFTARRPQDKKTDAKVFEDVDSEMYYISDSDFGYAQFTYRYSSSVENCTEIGFNYFNFKDKVMLEFNMSPSFEVTSLLTFGGSYVNQLNSFEQSEREQMQNLLKGLAKKYKDRKSALEQQNLALAKEAGIEGIKTDPSNENIFVKQKATEVYKVTFDCDILDDMLYIY